MRAFAVIVEGRLNDPGRGPHRGTLPMTEAKMNPERLRQRLLKLVTDACDAQMCPACVVAELAELAQAVIAATG